MLSGNNIIYDLQFGFRQNFSTSHALSSLTENIRQALGEGYIGCGIFVDLQKAFDTVDHEILIFKLDYHGIWDITGLNPTGAYLEGAKGTKTTFQILAKCCVFIAAVKRKASLWNEFRTYASVCKKPWIL